MNPTDRLPPLAKAHAKLLSLKRELAHMLALLVSDPFARRAHLRRLKTFRRKVAAEVHRFQESLK